METIVIFFSMNPLFMSVFLRAVLAFAKSSVSIITCFRDESFVSFSTNKSLWSVIVSLCSLLLLTVLLEALKSLSILSVDTAPMDSDRFMPRLRAGPLGLPWKESELSEWTELALPPERMQKYPVIPIKSRIGNKIRPPKVAWLAISWGMNNWRLMLFKNGSSALATWDS